MSLDRVAIPPVSWADVSWRKMARLPARKEESKATNKTRMPMPPNHCVNERQRMMPDGISLRSTITVAPVVVNPDMDSNKASTTLSLGSLST